MRNFVYLLSLFSSYALAQLSNQHWIPPLHARSASAVAEQYIYISTPNPTPFQVTITSGNGVPIAGSPFTISQGSPANVLIGNGQPSVMFLNQNDVNAVQSNKGLILSGAEDFYASFRVRSENHAEILVSKGIPGIGTTFRLGSLPQTFDGGARNFVSSVMATENNTTVSISDYDPGVIFVSGAGFFNAATQTFTLNAGQSIVFSGYTNTFANLDGFIGALVTADKPVAVNTGNALAGMQSENSGQDFTLDQIVSVEQIGTEYLVVKGNGSTNVEKPLVVAHEDNTEIFVNGSTTPLATLNAGEYLAIPTLYYQGTSNQNMYITSSKPIYLYQIIGGSQSDATSGLNFIPPLSCFFQKSVDLIPDLDKIGFYNYQTNIIIITKTGATVTINGNPITFLPQAVLGTTEWETYQVSGYTGNVKIESTKALAAGVFGFNANAGFGGYYSGFGSEPKDTNVTVCSSGTIDLLEEIIGNPETGGTWLPALASGSDIFNPQADAAGTYNYSYADDCATISVDVIVAIETAPNVGSDNAISPCANDAVIDLFPLLGTGVDATGVWSPAMASGTSVFDPVVDASGDYVYTITTGSATCPRVSATISVNVIALPTATISNLETCDDLADGDNTNGFATFDYTTKTPEIVNGLPNTIASYHLTQTDAENNTNPQTIFYATTHTVFVRLYNSVTNCFSVVTFEAIVNPTPVLNQNVILQQCDSDTDAISDFNLEQVNLQLSTDTDLTFTYFLTESEALSNTNPIQNYTAFSATNGDIVWVKAIDSKGCEAIVSVELQVSVSVFPANYVIPFANKCDEDLGINDPADDGIHYFDFTPATTTLLALYPQPMLISYYENEQDALAETNPITNITNYRNTNSPYLQIIWVRVENAANNACSDLGPFLHLVVKPLPVVDLGEDFTFCVDATDGTGVHVLQAQNQVASLDTYSYVWTPTNPNTNALNEESPIYYVHQAGTYSVTVTNNTTRCSITDAITIAASSEPESVTALLLTPLFSVDTFSIQAIVNGGFGVYEYSINNGVTWQSDPVFSNLPFGNYTILARDEARCGLVTSKSVQMVNYPRFFTPNGDGINDTWNILGLSEQHQATISIFDRYGKLLYFINRNSNSWDGSFVGQQLPASDYWFRVEYTENNQRKSFVSHFSLMR